MKTITEANMKRLIVQRDEAKTVGLNKIASQLSAQIGTVGVRGDSDDYHYSKEELRNEIESSLWDVAIRAQDFYGKFADARVVQDIIEKQADEYAMMRAQEVREWAEREFSSLERYLSDVADLVAALSRRIE